MDELRYEIQLFGEESQQQDAPAAEQNAAVDTQTADAPATENAGGDSGESFEELIRGRYKEAFDERVQKILGSRLRKLRQENDELQSRMQRQETREEQTIEELVRSADAIRTMYPAYDPVQEAKDPNFCRMVRAGISPCAAYEAVHHKELMKEAMEYAAKRSARQITRAIASGGARVAENGGGSMAVSRSDPKTLTSQELADIRKRVFSGEKIRF